MGNSKFIIRTRKFQKNSLSLKKVVTDDLMKLLSKRILGKSVSFEIEYIEERNVGNYIIFEHQKHKNYIILLNYKNAHGKSEGRNSFVQSIPTAYLDYLSDTSFSKSIYFYDVHYSKQRYSSYIEAFLRLAVTIGIKSLNNNQLDPFTSLDELIEFRNNNKSRSKQNNPSYIERTQSGLNIFGKVFGANSKDTEMICHAINYFYAGKITLYQIKENKSTKLSSKFLAYLESTDKFIIEDDVYTFSDILAKRESNETINLRNPRFINNLFEHYGDKKCALCDCNIHQVIDGAHIFPIEAIKDLNITDQQKLDLATNPRNGIWLCKNHHKLFDSHMIYLYTNGYELNPSLDARHRGFIENSIKSDHLFLLENLDENFINLRYEFFSGI